MYKRLFKFSKLKLFTLVTIGGVSCYVNRKNLLNKFAKKTGIYAKIAKLANKSNEEINKVDTLVKDYFASIGNADKNKTIDELMKEYKMSQEIKEYQQSSQAKLNEIYDKVMKYDKEIKELNKQLEENKKRIDESNKKEEEIINEVNKEQKELEAKANELNEKCLQLNTERLQLMQLINNQYNKYTNVFNTMQSKFDSKFKSELEQVKKESITPLSDEELNKLSKEEIISKINELKDANHKFIKDQAELILNDIKSNDEQLEEYGSKLKEYLKENENLAKTYLEFKHDEYDIKNKILSLELLKEYDKTTKSENYKKMLAEYKEQHNNNFVKNVYPHLLEYIKNERDIMLKMNSNVSKDEVLKLQNNFNYIKNSYKSKSLDILLGLKYSLYRALSPQMHSQNILSLLKISKSYNDDFTYDLINNSNIIQAPPCNSLQLLNEFEKVKKNLSFNIISGTKTSLYKIILSPLISLCGYGLMSVYHPYYTPIRENDREIVKKIKALRFVEYYLKKGDLYNSYFNMKYLKDYDTEISKLRVMINSKIKNDSFIELYEHHIL